MNVSKGQHKTKIILITCILTQTDLNRNRDYVLSTKKLNWLGAQYLCKKLIYYKKSVNKGKHQTKIA